MTTPVHEATDILLSTAHEYGNSNARSGDVVAAAYRLAASKLHEHGSHPHAQDLENAADQAESRARLERGIPREAESRARLERGIPREARKTLALPKFLTSAQIFVAQNLFKIYGDRAVKQIQAAAIEPNMAAINAKLGQENDASYLAYAVVYVLTQAEEQRQS